MSDLMIFTPTSIRIVKGLLKKPGPMNIDYKLFGEVRNATIIGTHIDEEVLSDAKTKRNEVAILNIANMSIESIPPTARLPNRGNPNGVLVVYKEDKNGPIQIGSKKYSAEAMDLYVVRGNIQVNPDMIVPLSQLPDSIRIALKMLAKQEASLLMELSRDKRKEAIGSGIIGFLLGLVSAMIVALRWLV